MEESSPEKLTRDWYLLSDPTAVHYKSAEFRINQSYTTDADAVDVRYCRVVYPITIIRGFVKIEPAEI